MRRRDFLTTAAALSLAMALGAQGAPVTKPSRKKGLGDYYLTL
jgi:anaerobic selenocysteine-containing dehydrogenase